MWDAAYQEEAYIFGTAPNDFLAGAYDHFPKGDLLSLGEGEGRNAVFLATHGYQVVAVDAAASGFVKGQKLAEAHQVAVNWQHADLNDYSLGKQRWDGILSIFCHLPPELRKKVHLGAVHALRPNGVFLLEAYAPAQLRYGTGGPQSLAMLPTLSELLQDFPGLKVLHAQTIERNVTEGTRHTGLAMVNQLVLKKEVVSIDV
ncbi:MAG TPA: class I SAM-dependent methyltransferase [Rhodothermales bacterium]|nr:class I SAM-dependent methyltransferase [Rhodothermales bacterium]